MLLTTVSICKMRNLYGRIALKKHCISFLGNNDKLAELLIQNGADVNVVNVHGDTALNWAAKKGEKFDFHTYCLHTEDNSHINAKQICEYIWFS